MMTVSKKSAESTSERKLKKTKSKVNAAANRQILEKKILKAAKNGTISQDVLAKIKKQLGIDIPLSVSNTPVGKAQEIGNSNKNKLTGERLKKKRKFEDGNPKLQEVGEASAGKPLKKSKTLSTKRPKTDGPTREIDQKDTSKQSSKLKGILKNKKKAAQTLNIKKIDKERLSKRQQRIIDMKQKKMRPANLSKKDRRALRVLQRRDGDLIQRLLAMWEELRHGSCAAERRTELCDEILNASKGRISQLVLAHDTSRVFETVLKLGSGEQRIRILEELKDVETMRQLLRSKFGKFVLHKMLMHGTRAHKECVFAAMNDKVVKLAQHRQAIFILNVAFNDHANAEQRAHILQELYGPPFSVFKKAGVTRLADAFASEPSVNKEHVLAFVKAVLLKAIAKSNVNYFLIHTLILDFLENCSEADKAELSQALHDHVVALLHTREGVKAAMMVLWHSKNKDRKNLIRSMKTYFSNTAVDENGYLFILSILDNVDDIVLLEKTVLKELFESLDSLIESPHGRKVILYMLNQRSPTHFHPQLLEILRKGDSNPYTKKSSSIRKKELRDRALLPLINCAVHNLSLVCSPNHALMILRELLVTGGVDKPEQYGALVAKVASCLVDGELLCEDGKEALAVNAGGHIALKKALQEAKEVGSEFGQRLLNEFKGKSLKQLLSTNRGCFLLVTLCETVNGAEESLSKILKSDLDFLLQQTTVGANILKKKVMP